VTLKKLVELTEQSATELLKVEVLSVKNIKIEYARLLFLLIVLYGYKTLSLIMAVTHD
jgi:hypothetical protein